MKFSILRLKKDLLELYSYQKFLLRMMRAAMTPGTHPQQVRIVTMRIDPQPQSITARGGKIIANRTLKQDMVILVLLVIFRRAKIQKTDKFQQPNDITLPRFL